MCSPGWNVSTSAKAGGVQQDTEVQPAPTPPTHLLILLVLVQVRPLQADMVSSGKRVNVSMESSCLHATDVAGNHGTTAVGVRLETQQAKPPAYSPTLEATCHVPSPVDAILSLSLNDHSCYHPILTCRNATE
jgi:hypothetical protein